MLQAEEARTRGTPVTVESFKSWKAKFDREMAVKKAKEDEEKILHFRLSIAPDEGGASLAFRGYSVLTWL